jgi:endonuclease/exonuclease/phosphatase family metal-dependent hydrolase
MDTRVSAHECRIATYNIFHDLPAFRHLDRRLELSAEAMAARRPHVLAVQEIARANRCGDLGAKLVAMVNEACGADIYTLVYAPADGAGEDEYAFDEGVAIMTLHEVVSHDVLKYRAQVRLTTTVGGHQYRLPDDRIAMRMRLRTDSGAFDIYATHLTDSSEQAGNGATIRSEQARELLEWVERSSGAIPVFIAGDFNDLPESESVAIMLKAGFADTYSASGIPPGNTNDADDINLESPEATHNRRIDFIFARPPRGGSMKILNAELFIDRPHQEPGGKWLWPSDHIGVLTTARF